MEQVSTQESHRETMVTLPQVSAEAYASMSEVVSDGLGELTSTELDWAVDVEPMRAMTTFDLWMALATGDLPRAVRVWKLGRERWQPAEDIPELACALTLQRRELFPFVPQADAEAFERAPVDILDETPPATVTNVDPTDADVEILTPAAPAVVAGEASRESGVHLAARSEAPQRSRVRNAVALAVAAVVTALFAIAAPSTERRAHAAVGAVFLGEATVLTARTVFDTIAARAEALAALPVPQPPEAAFRLAGEPERAEPRAKKKRVVSKPKGQKRVSRTGKETRGARGLKPAR